MPSPPRTSAATADPLCQFVSLCATRSVCLRACVHVCGGDGVHHCGAIGSFRRGREDSITFLSLALRFLSAAAIIVLLLLATLTVHSFCAAAYGRGVKGS
eukprot:GHVU01005279.1.p4 GENE.GHVU01005279.1~~GHVU01005279.1.p4  ORF type:complete len:100 (+),score=1.48 GHVU01005279.1:367-666(+)